MAIPVMPDAVAQAVTPLLGVMLVQSCPIVEDLTDILRSYAPYRQSLEAFRDEVENALLRLLGRYTHGSMLVIADNYQPIRLGREQLRHITDEVMGVLFESLTPFSANFIKLNDYSLRVQSLSALRVLVTRYASYYTQADLRFIARMIRSIYPPHQYQGWLPIDW
ncbi:MAG: hypothetical protein J6K73_01425 [Clostridia bacterium]|nr:hypothetical protein [Clostridia bacterium]MBP3648423.1 hypothetical protein [Clostridia bacterium]